MITVFVDCRMIVVDVMPEGDDSYACIRTLTKFGRRFK